MLEHIPLTACEEEPKADADEIHDLSEYTIFAL